MAVGLAALARPAPPIDVPTRAGLAVAESAAVADLAVRSLGAGVRASSSSPFDAYHPVFAIDGQVAPLDHEAWVSAREDRAPWLEVRLPRRADVQRVRLVFSRSGRPPADASGSYVVLCLRTTPGGAEEAVASEEVGPEHLLGAARTHDLDCSGVDLVTVRFDGRASPRGVPVATLYELEALGTWSTP